MTYRKHKPNLRQFTFRLGDSFNFRGMKITFTKTTRKGFNFYVEGKHSLLFRNQLYCRKWSNVTIPQGEEEFEVTLSESRWFLMNLPKW